MFISVFSGAIKEETVARMSDRQYTIMCCFDPRSPILKAYHIHEWIHENLHLAEDDVRMIQIDGLRRRI